MTPADGPPLWFLLVTVAREDRQPGIFREAWIGVGEFAEIEDGTVRRFNAARMNTLGAKPRGRMVCLFFGRQWHSGRIAQMKGSTLAEVYLTINLIKRSFIIGFTIVNSLYVVWSRSPNRPFLAETN